MGCRCADIEMYEADVRTLNKAIEQAEALIGHADSVNEGIANLGTMYSRTLNTTDEFYSKLSKLDEGAQGKAATIRTKLEIKRNKAQAWLREASEEDAAFDHVTRALY